MVPIDEYLLQLQNSDPDNPAPDTIYDDILAEYNNDMTAAGAKVSEHEETIKALEAEKSALKAKNYDLLVASATPPEESGSNSDGVGESEDDAGGIDDMFDSDEDKD